MLNLSTVLQKIRGKRVEEITAGVDVAKRSIIIPYGFVVCDIFAFSFKPHDIIIY
jgi:hypothetical protein